ncbi:MAG TPA: hemin uptake protein HemP [Methylomirabilota bacterium]|nr:hemin uptake protein HemP [Methylomirabilota bacterium]
MSATDPGGAQANDRDGGLPRAASPPVSSASLFRGRREVVILHRGQEYRLRITKADKLILTK